jgi:hypothetical protein
MSMPTGGIAFQFDVLAAEALREKEIVRPLMFVDRAKGD